MPRRPLEILHCVVILGLLLLTAALAAAGRLPIWAPTARSLFFLLGVVLLVSWCERRGWRGLWWEVVANFYSFYVITGVFNSLQPLITAVGFPNGDAALAAIDRAMLGGWDATVLTRPLIRPWLNDLLHLSYLTFFTFPIVVGVSMWRRSRALVRRFVFMVAATFYASYAGYFFVPAHGPRFVQWAGNVETRTTPISRWIFDTLTAAEATRDDVFPSGHNMVTAACVIAAFQFNRRLGRAVLPFALSLAFSTIYCRYHYLIDAIAGVALAFVTVPAAHALYDAWARRRGPVGPAVPADGFGPSRPIPPVKPAAGTAGPTGPLVHSD